MAKATSTLPTYVDPAIAAAAAEIHALINSRPTSPRPEEIAAIIAANVQRGIWTEWAALVARYNAACAKIEGAEKASAGQSAIDVAVAEERAANRRLTEYAARILAERPMRRPLFAAAFLLLHHGFVVDAD